MPSLIAICSSIFELFAKNDYQKKTEKYRKKYAFPLLKRMLRLCRMDLRLF